MSLLYSNNPYCAEIILLRKHKDIWVRSRNCGCLVTWFCYQLIAKPGNKTAAVSWPNPYVFAFSIISQQWNGAGSCIPSSRKTRTHLSWTSIPVLLMPWRRKSPGHQQPWYWASNLELSQFQHLKGWLRHQHFINLPPGVLQGSVIWCHISVTGLEAANQPWW